MIELDQAGRSAKWAETTAPPPSLRRWIESTTIVRYPDDLDVGSWLIVPDVSAHVIVAADRGGRVRVRLVGPRSVAARFPLRERRWLAALRLRPGAIAGWGGRSGHEWTNRAEPLADCVPSSLRGRALDVEGEDPGTALLGLLDLFDEWSRQLREPDWRVSALIRGAASRPDVSGIAESMGVSTRSLRDVIGRETGLGPKRALRIRRLHRAASRIILSDDALSRIAADSGFVDQAHMARDFIALMGEAPSFYRARRGGDAVSYKTRPGDAAHVR